MTSDRPYRKAPGFAVVGEEILRCAERQFDPRLAEIFLQVSESTWREIRARSEEKKTALAR